MSPLASLRIRFCAVLLACATVAIPVNAQRKVSPSAAFREARTLYYTPTDHGLQGFQCNVSFDWKGFLQNANPGAAPDAPQPLAYLQNIKLTVTDDVNGSGSIHWNAPVPPSDVNPDSIAKLHSSLQALWTDFFDTWNGLYSGDLLSLNDDKTTVDRTPSGYHVFARDNGRIAEESYTGDFTLQSVHVSTPGLDRTVTPRFERTPKGRLITAWDSTVKQPPTAPGTTVSTTVHYAPVQGFQIPSDVRMDVAGTATFNFQLTGCSVNAKPTAK